jgi:flagellar export protein FliJ
MGAFQFRLQPLLDREIERRNKAQEALAARQAELRVEMETAAELRRRETRIEERRTTRRRELLAGAATGAEVQQRAEYLAALGHDLEAAHDAVFSQQMVVREAEDKVAHARGQLAECSRRVEVLQKYRGRLEERWRKEAERKQAVEQDEMGNVLYLTRRRRS